MNAGHKVMVTIDKARGGLFALCAKLGPCGGPSLAEKLVTLARFCILAQ